MGRTVALLFTTVLLLLVPLTAFSTHIVGGSTTYRHLSGENYEIEVRLYRDCYNGIPELLNPIYISVYDSGNNFIRSIMMYRTNKTHIPAPDIYNFPCHYRLPPLCYEYGVYKSIVKLPYKAGGYTLTYESCCLNWSITNHIVNSGFTTSTVISDSALLNGNSSPEFLFLPPAVVCRGLPFVINHSASDIDGDSLTYELFTPFKGTLPPFIPIPYASGYNLNTVTASVDELKIDSLSGMLSATIDSFGQYLYGVKVNEYRNGYYIGSTWRTYQINAASCDTLVVTADFDLTQRICTKELIINFKGESKNAARSFWNFGDSTTAVGHHPVHVYRDSGEYWITLIATSTIPGCADTLLKQIHVDTILAEDGLFANFSAIEKSCKSTIFFKDTSQYAAELYWDFGDQSPIDTSRHPVHVYTKPGSYRVRLVAVSATNKCRDTLDKQVDIREKLTFSPFFTNGPCSNTIAVNPNITGGNPMNYSLQWDFGNSDISFSDSLHYTYLDTGHYLISLFSIANDGYVDCNDTAYLTFYAKPLIHPEVTVSASEDTLYYLSDSSTLRAEPNDYRFYRWYPPSEFNDNTLFNPNVRPKRTTTYTVKVINNLGCSTTKEITIVVSPLLCGESEVFIPNSFTPNNDGENDFFRIRGKEISALYLTVYNRWGERIFESTDVGMLVDPYRGWDGTYHSKKVDPGVFVYYARVSCFGGEEFTRKGNITVLR
jgi:gliding motility-associated-like protein